MKTRFYLYGVVRNETTSSSEEPISFQLSEVSFELKLKYYDQLGLVYSEIETEEEELRPTRKNLVNHQKVVEGLMKEYQVLPFRFGMMVDEPSELDALIAAQKEDLTNKLDQTLGKVELSLKVLWKDMDLVFANLIGESPTIQQKRKELANNDHQNARIELGKIVEETLKNTRNRLQTKVLTQLSEIAVDHKVLKNISEEMITNLVFLVEKKQESSFDEAVNALSEDLAENITFKYIGPSPPYNFL